MSETEVIEGTAVEETVVSPETETATPVATETPESVTASGEELDLNADRGDGRNARGQWVGKGEPPPASPEETAKPPADEATKAAATATPAKTPVEPAAFVPPSGEPHVVKAHGKQYTTGAVLTEHGMWVPKESVPIVNQFLSEGLDYKLTWKDRESKAEEAGYTRGREFGNKLSDTILAAWNQAKTLGKWDPIQEFFATFETNLPRMIAEHERDEYKRKIEEREQATKAQETEQQTLVQEQQKDTALTETIGEARKDPKYAALTADDWTEAQDWINDAKGALFVTDGDGDLCIDTKPIARTLDRILKFRTQQTAVAKAAGHNKRNEAKPQATPTVPATKPSTPSESRAQYKNREEWEKAHGLA